MLSLLENFKFSVILQPPNCQMYLFIYLFIYVAVVQYNNWFTFSEYEEPVTIRSCRPIHARELATVSILSNSCVVQHNLQMLFRHESYSIV